MAQKVKFAEVIIQIVMSPAGTIYGLSNAGQLFKFDGVTGEWQLKSSGLE